MTDHRYSYLTSSTAVADERRLAVATSGGRVANPFLFHGYVDAAGSVAQAVLAVADVAAARYFDARLTAVFLDPILTANESVLRFESFSACNGVYARFDLPASKLDGELAAWGTTNIDLNTDMRTVLAMIGDGEPMELSVGHDEVMVATLDGAAVEKKVPLPERWVRGLAEVSVAVSGMLEIHDVAAIPARRLIADLTLRDDRKVLWVDPSAGGRPRRMAAPGTISLSGPGRLGALRRLLPRIKRLRVYAPPPAERRGPPGAGRDRAAQASAWVVDLDAGRLTLALSPQERRGFSGEGGVLEALAAVSEQLLEAGIAMLHGQAEIRPDDVAAALGLGLNEARHLVDALAAAGRVGYDLETESYFHRDLPFDLAAIEKMQPRLRSAQAIIDGGGVEVTEHRARVASGDAIYVVEFDATGANCSCPWFAHHRGERGPCKHVLAATMARRQAPVERP